MPVVSLLHCGTQFHRTLQEFDSHEQHGALTGEGQGREGGNNMVHSQVRDREGGRREGGIVYHFPLLTLFLLECGGVVERVAASCLPAPDTTVHGRTPHQVTRWLQKVS